ncbi:MAG: hypothetical protein M5U11_00945 [Anaerolineales bacterium]|nr:hypothetical protein [Anaerolineales bacterium]
MDGARRRGTACGSRPGTAAPAGATYRVGAGSVAGIRVGMGVIAGSAAARRQAKSNPQALKKRNPSQTTINTAKPARTA